MKPPFRAELAEFTILSIAKSTVTVRVNMGTSERRTELFTVGDSWQFSIGVVNPKIKKLKRSK